jgi:uncharacterized protein (DUF302 family)
MPIVLQSRFRFDQTISELLSAISASGSIVFLKLDQAEAARSVGLSLRPTMLIIFGNPRAGTTLMQEDPLLGVDLPLKILIWEDELGVTHAAYRPVMTTSRAPAEFAPTLDKINRVLTQVVESIS